LARNLECDGRKRTVKTDETARRVEAAIPYFYKSTFCLNVYSCMDIELLSLVYLCLHETGAVVAQWLRYCATNQKVAGSILDCVMEFFIDINPSDRTVALGWTQPLTEMSTGSISWG
jgi:hypothetical protein